MRYRTTRNSGSAIYGPPSLPEAGEYARTRAITADEENAIDIEQLESIGLRCRRNFRSFAHETPQIQLQANRIQHPKAKSSGRKVQISCHSQCRQTIYRPFRKHSKISTRKYVQRQRQLEHGHSSDTLLFPCGEKVPLRNR